MTQRFATTPFGGGRFTASDFQVETWVERRRAELAKGGNETGTVDKFQLLRALTEARLAFGLGDRAITVLDALLTFHQDRELNGAEATVVFPSNRELGLRTRGMADRTLRTHLRTLVRCGLVLRRDSPNGKRYSLKDDRGHVAQAFGFDLSPLALKATEIFEAAERARAHWKACRKVRGEITVHLRDVCRIIGTAREEKRVGDWNAMESRLRTLSGRVGRTTPLKEHEARRDELVALRADVENLYLSTLSEQEMAANDGGSDRHIQNSNLESRLNLSVEKKKEEPLAEGRREDEVVQLAEADAGEPKAEPGSERSPGRKPPVSLDLFAQACPQFLDYARHGVRSWRDVIATGDLVRGALGISPDAMCQAVRSMGDVPAAITVAAILERHEEIRSPGGYLRSLSARATEDRFSVRPMLDALLNARLKEERRTRE